jgi:hypothetical protein
MLDVVVLVSGMAVPFQGKSYYVDMSLSFALNIVVYHNTDKGVSYSEVSRGLISGIEKIDALGVK